MRDDTHMFVDTCVSLCNTLGLVAVAVVASSQVRTVYCNRFSEATHCSVGATCLMRYYCLLITLVKPVTKTTLKGFY